MANELWAVELDDKGLCFEEPFVVEQSDTPDVRDYWEGDQSRAVAPATGVYVDENSSRHIFSSRRDAEIFISGVVAFRRVVKRFLANYLEQTS